MSDPRYAYPYPAQGGYQGPPMMAPPPQYPAPRPYPAPQPSGETGCLEGFLAALCCCWLFEECCDNGEAAMGGNFQPPIVDPSLPPVTVAPVFVHREC